MLILKDVSGNENPYRSVIPLQPAFTEAILNSTGAESLSVAETVQELWSGYGEILRIRLEGGDRNSVIVKHIAASDSGNHPRGWNSDISHQRKLKSYEVETEWYRSWSERERNRFRIPEYLGFVSENDEVLLILEDLDASGYSKRLTSVDHRRMRACLTWLAEFHATFLGDEPNGLWEVGTYWHLATRPDELAALDDMALREAAPELDRILSEARYRTIVHGDAKLANFCFADDADPVAALDFQYVGGGCGMKDVAYFIGSCLDEASCEKQETELLDHYFAAFRRSLSEQGSKADSAAVEAEWRELFPVAWTDFHRFLKGWCPGHWKINTYSERIAGDVLRGLT